MHNLPTPISSFIGRSRELAQIKSLLTAPSTRLVTLTGAGGIGKSRLALQSARDLQNYFKDGAWLVELAPISEPNRLPGTIAQTLSVREVPGKPLLSILIEFLQDKNLLLLLDNCEHLIEECARLSETLLTACPGLSVLATSRESLALTGEITLQAPGLSLPPEPTSTTGLLPEFSSELTDKLAQSEAVQLFVERIRAVKSGFELTPRNAGAIADICLRLDGIPLALELAAARIKVLTVEQLAARLDDRFRLLTGGGSRTALPRQQTLQGLLDWSYNLLPEAQKVLLRRLAVFTGSFSLPAAEEICAGKYSTSSGQEHIQNEQVADLMWQLVNKSLVITQDTAPAVENNLNAPEIRYRLLETIRQYSRQHLEAAAEVPQFNRQHRDWYLHLAEEAAAYLTGPGQNEWMFRLELEQANMHAALAWSLQHHELEPAARMAIGLWDFWYTHLRLDEIRLLQQIQLQNEQTPLPLDIQARLFSTLGKANHSFFNDFERASFFHHKALAIWQQLDEKNEVARVMLDIGWHYFIQLKLDEAHDYANKILSIAPEVVSKWTIAAALSLKGMALLMSGKPQQALPLAEQSLVIWRKMGDKASLISTLTLLTQSQARQDNCEELKPQVAEAFALQLETGDAMARSVSLTILAHIAANAQKQPEGAVRASRLLGNNAREFETRNGPIHPFIFASLVNINGKIRSMLDEESYAHQFEAGKNITRAELLKLVEEVTELETNLHPLTGKPAAVNLIEVYPAGLTRREVEILRLVASGLSNPQIAQKLMLSRRTVEAHLHTIFGKIEVTSRVEATRFAFNNGLA